MAIEKVTKYIQMASINGFNEEEVSSFNWGNLITKVIDTGASLIQRNNQPSGGGGFMAPKDEEKTKSFDNNTLLLIGASGLVLYFILRKK